jgi:membrane protease YdiL (CAAX protease family)
MDFARNRLVLSLLAVAVWALITVGPGFLPREAPSIVRAILGVSSGVMVGVLLAIVVLAAFVILFRWNDLGFNRPRPWRSLWLMWLPGLYLVLFYGAGIAIGLPPLEAMALLFVNTLLVGVSEELAFRGVLLRGLMSRLGMWPSVLISSAVFGSVHVLNVLATGSLTAALAQAVAATMSGVFFAALVIRTGSILPSMGLHVLWNFGAFLIVTTAARQGEAALASGEAMPEMSPLVYLTPILFNLPIFLYALFLLRRGRTVLPAAPEGDTSASVAAV